MKSCRTALRLPVASLVRRRLRWSPPASHLMVVVVICVLCAVGVTAAAATTSASKPVLTWGIPGNFPNLNPALNYPDPSNSGLVYEPLIRANPNGSVSPGLAVSWHYVKGSANKAFEFTLRHNARFSDGTLVTAQAVKTYFDYKSKVNPDTGRLPKLVSVKTVGKWTVMFRIASPDPIIPQFSLSLGEWGWIGSPKAVAHPSLFQKGSYGAGPYMFAMSQSVVGDHYTLVPNPYYYDKSKQVWSKITIKTIGNPTSMLQAMQSGQIDVALGDPSTAAAAEAAGLKVVAGGGQNAAVQTMIIAGNGVTKTGTVAPLADTRVRQALNYAIDRNAIATALAGKYGKPTSAVGSPDASYPSYTNYYTYDPAKAKALLAAAGYPNGFTISTPLGAISTGYSISGVAAAQAVAKYWSAIGVNVTVKPEIMSQWITDSAEGSSAKGNTQAIYLWPLGIIYGWELFQPANAWNLSWNDSTLAALWTAGSKSADSARFWKQAMARVTTLAYYVPIYQQDELWYVNAKKVTGVVCTAYGPSWAETWRPAS